MCAYMCKRDVKYFSFCAKPGYTTDMRNYRAIRLEQDTELLCRANGQSVSETALDEASNLAHSVFRDS